MMGEEGRGWGDGGMASLMLADRTTWERECVGNHSLESASKTLSRIPNYGDRLLLPCRRARVVVGGHRSYQRPF